MYICWKPCSLLVLECQVLSIYMMLTQWKKVIVFHGLEVCDRLAVDDNHN